MNLVPYVSSPALTRISSSARGVMLPGKVQGVQIILESTDYEFILHKIIGWFRDRDEVDLADHGITDKRGYGYIMLEWTEQEVDQLFLDILRDEEWAHDYIVYMRDL